jgi:hypothetical protein
LCLTSRHHLNQCLLLRYHLLLTSRQHLHQLSLLHRLLCQHRHRLRQRMWLLCYL